MKKLNNPRGELKIRQGTVYSFPVHLHTYYEMTLYRPFCGGVLINGERIPMETVSAVLICPTDFHEIVVEEPTDATFIKVSFNGDLFGGGGPNVSAVLSNLESEDFGVRLFEELLREGKDRSYAEQLIRTAVQLIVRRGKGVRPVAVSRGYRIATECVGYLHEHFREELTLERVAKQLSVAPQYLSGVFKRVLGVNFSAYLIRLRLEYAASLLRGGEGTVTEICFECGFSNVSHFTRSFRGAYGQSPTAYRCAAAVAREQMLDRVSKPKKEKP